MNRRAFSARLSRTGLAGATLALLGAAGRAGAQNTAQTPPAGGMPVEGRQFSKVEPPQAPTLPATAGKIEVIEFFSYACPHCNAFEPAISAWAAKLPPDVTFHRIPVAFLFNAENFMKLYFALEQLGAVDAMQKKVFAAVHVEKQYLDKPADITALVQKNGIDPAKFNAAFASFGVATSVARAKKAMAAYKLESVPTLAVAGRWMTSPAQAGGFEQATAVADALIQRARSNKG